MNPQETSTKELVEIVKQQAESWQKPDGAIWNELMARYRWPGCPKEDFALIASSDSLLQPLNNGRTMLPPVAIQIPGAGISPPPPYYQKKVSLSQVINKSPGDASKKDSEETVMISPSNRKSFSLEKLRSELTSSQLKYLNLFWEHFLDYRQWPKTIDFHRDHDREEVRASLRASPLNGSIVMEQIGAGDEHYELTLVGILLTKDGKHYETMRIRLLEFLSKKYYHTKREERKNRYSDEEIAEEIKLSKEDAKMLGMIGTFDQIYYIGGLTVGGNWSIEFPRKEIQSIPREGPFSDYHETIVFQQYYPQYKVFIEDRHAAQTVAVFPKSLFSEGSDALDTPDSSSESDHTSPSMPVPDVSFVQNEKLRTFAAAAAKEASRCFGVKAFTASAVMAGSAIEAVLLDLLLQNKDKLTISKDNPLEKQQLADLIKTASKMDLLGTATSTLTQFAQQHRNLIHPGKFLREKRIIGRGDAQIIGGIFTKICDELNPPEQ